MDAGHLSDQALCAVQDKEMRPLTSILFGIFASGVTFWMLLCSLKDNDLVTAVYVAFLLGVLVEATAIVVGMMLAAAPLIRSTW